MLFSLLQPVDDGPERLQDGPEYRVGDALQEGVFDPQQGLTQRHQVPVQVEPVDRLLVPDGPALLPGLDVRRRLFVGRRYPTCLQIEQEFSSSGAAQIFRHVVGGGVQSILGNEVLRHRFDGLQEGLLERLRRAGEGFDPFSGSGFFRRLVGGGVEGPEKGRLMKVDPVEAAFGVEDGECPVGQGRFEAAHEAGDVLLVGFVELDQPLRQSNLNVIDAQVAQGHQPALRRQQQGL